MKTEPSGSQIFWLSIALSVYIALWIRVYTYSFANIEDQTTSVVVLSAASFAICFIHFMEYFTSDYTNVLHYLNPLILLKLFVFWCAKQIQKFNKFLDKLFD